MKTMLRTVNDGSNRYQALYFCCPGCAEMYENDGLHILAVNTDEVSPSWSFDGDFDAPTLSPSVLTRRGQGEGVCHSFLRNGIFQYLNDSTHSMAGKHVPIPDLPDWVVNTEADRD